MLHDELRDSSTVEFVDTETIDASDLSRQGGDLAELNRFNRLAGTWPAQAQLAVAPPDDALLSDFKGVAKSRCAETLSPDLVIEHAGNLE
jgi:hypothetical protein